MFNTANNSLACFVKKVPTVNGIHGDVDFVIASLSVHYFSNDKWIYLGQVYPNDSDFILNCVLNDASKMLPSKFPSDIKTFDIEIVSMMGTWKMGHSILPTPTRINSLEASVASKTSHP